MLNFAFRFFHKFENKHYAQWWHTGGAGAPPESACAPPIIRACHLCDGKEGAGGSGDALPASAGWSLWSLQSPLGVAVAATITAIGCSNWPLQDRPQGIHFPPICRNTHFLPGLQDCPRGVSRTGRRGASVTHDYSEGFY